jgi:hypothetical protein
MPVRAVETMTASRIVKSPYAATLPGDGKRLNKRLAFGKNSVVRRNGQFQSPISAHTVTA